MADEAENMPGEKKDQEKTVDKKPSSNLPIIAGIIAGVIVINSLLAFVLIQLLKPPNPEDVDAKMKADSLKQSVVQETTVGAITESIEAVVNIAGTEGMRFLKVVLVLEYDDQEYKKLGDELLRRSAKLKDMLIEQLSAMTLEEINDNSVRGQIRKEFMRTVNITLPEKIGKISNVYLNEFIVQ